MSSPEPHVPPARDDDDGSGRRAVVKTTIIVVVFVAIAATLAWMLTERLIESGLQ